MLDAAAAYNLRFKRFIVAVVFANNAQVGSAHKNNNNTTTHTGTHTEQGECTDTSGNCNHLWRCLCRTRPCVVLSVLCQLFLLELTRVTAGAQEESIYDAISICMPAIVCTSTKVRAREGEGATESNTSGHRAGWQRRRSHSGAVWGDMGDVCLHMSCPLLAPCACPVTRSLRSLLCAPVSNQGVADPPVPSPRMCAPTCPHHVCRHSRCNTGHNNSNKHSNNSDEQYQREGERNWKHRGNAATEE